MISLRQVTVADMTAQISCPNCLHPVDTQARFCGHCGVDLALAAAAAEHSLGALPEIPPGSPVSPEALVPRIGDTMIEMGLLQVSQLQQALDYQRAQRDQGRSLLLGQVLIELGMTDQKTLDRVVTVQIQQLHSALQEANRVLEQRVQERTQDLQRALSRLAELNQLKANFIANISHELRTPLTHLKGYLDLLAEGVLGELTTQQQEAMRVLLRSESRLEQLIEDLIQFSLASRGELRLFYSPVQINRLVQSATDRSRSKASVKQIDIQAVLAEGDPIVRADEEKIGWVIMQLVDNAIKFTNPQGTVTIRAACQDGDVQITVADTGIGIPAEKVREIFEPFHQLDSSTTRRYSGTGLGLAMVHRILEAHHSQIEVDSEPGKGASFVFTLPVVTSLNHQGSEGTGELLWSAS